MGVREDLLSGAKRCLAERGYSRTTVRDIVAASGTNLAAINYHFGSKDALLYEAMVASTAEAVDETLEVGPSDADPADRSVAFWAALTESFTRNRALWATNIEVLTQALHSPELRAQLSGAQADARRGLAEMLHPVPGEPDDRTQRTVGAVHYTLLAGLLVQWMVDPAAAPSADELAEGLLAVAEHIRTRPDAPS
ncbi:TetR/AcrR family transcriptional regulator [Amycolatopsis aidingensis]|uniref:TetR/AcrR family transcriptional regulator n=1 Tax=Amycolatopsis aidingensis TaxID=2842453 RepID=UPI001C0E4B8E|nr:TetR/AcrR family transcriptional regulator [Amycolatopsis aidingensis]